MLFSYFFCRQFVNRIMQKSEFFYIIFSEIHNIEKDNSLHFNELPLTFDY